jgi:uncharacterized phosphosugar-binding protein
MTQEHLDRADATSNAKVKQIDQIAKFIAEGGGTFRVFCAHVGLSYEECYRAGGMLISNTIDKALYHIDAKEKP